MKAVIRIIGTAVPLNRSDVDTDQIIPSEYLKSISKTGFEAGLFAKWREDEPDFVLNQERFRGAKVLIAGPNFGTGSSREHAVWAIAQYGFEAVICSSFGDIFKNNSENNGLLPIVLPEDTVEALLEAVENRPELQFEIDVASTRLSVPAIGLEAEFPLSEGVKERLLNGYDDISLTLKHEDEIKKYESTRPSFKPRIKSL
jgi:3-isopropylmalate/(R)-2-methylmalate dehydratase small subunit